MVARPCTGLEYMATSVSRTYCGSTVLLNYRVRSQSGPTLDLRPPTANPVDEIRRLHALRIAGTRVSGLGSGHQEAAVQMSVMAMLRQLANQSSQAVTSSGCVTSTMMVARGMARR